MTSKFILRVLSVISENDMHGELFWRCDGECAPVRFFINCSDVFWWGTADAVDLTPETLPVLEQVIADLKPHGANWCIAELFAARIRKLRPQGAAYPEDRELWPLFDACGPERETGLGNPYKPGDPKE